MPHAVDCAGGERRTRGLLHRSRLAGNHAFIYVACALMHHAIHRHALTGAQTQDIPYNNVFNRSFHKLPSPAQLRSFHAQAQKTLNGPSRAPFGAVFKIAPEQDQDDNQTRRFIVNARNPLW